MTIRLEKGQRISLEKSGGAKLTSFCVGCNWGAIETDEDVEVKVPIFGGLFGSTTRTKRQKVVHEIDLDLSCIMTDQQGALCDHIYSPLYKQSFLSRYQMPPGKLDSTDRALHHSGDDRIGDTGGDDGLDNEIITVDLNRVHPGIQQIFFFLNNCGREDFSQIPYASIRMYEGSPTRVQTVFAQYDVAAAPQFRGMLALIMGKLYRRNGEWKFAAIGDAFADNNICETIQRILKSYAR